MLGKTLVILGAVASICLLMVGFWLWEHPSRVLLSADVERPEMLLWSVRLAAAAAVAGAQVIALICVVGPLYRRRMGDWIARAACGGMCIAALVGALTCGWLSRG